MYLFSDFNSNAGEENHDLYRMRDNGSQNVSHNRRESSNSNLFDNQSRQIQDSPETSPMITGYPQTFRQSTETGLMLDDVRVQGDVPYSFYHSSEDVRNSFLREGTDEDEINTFSPNDTDIYAPPPSYENELNTNAPNVTNSRAPPPSYEDACKYYMDPPT